MTIPTNSSTAIVLSESVRSAIRREVAADHQSVIALVQQLVRVPSRGGIDPYDQIIDLIVKWLGDHHLRPCRLLDGDGTVVGLTCDVLGEHPGPRYILDACVDTAPFGDPDAWRHSATSGVVEDGWLYGRGAADCKAAVAIFAHVSARVLNYAKDLHGTLTLLFDADEHTGRFGGAKQYFTGPDAPTDVAGVMIGYPGMEELVIGGRGFLRAQLTVHGKAGHSGGRRLARDGNAVEKAGLLVHELTRHRQPASADPTLGLAPQLTVTAVHGGEGYSIVPDRCTINVDVRLTTSYEATDALSLLEQVVADVDQRWQSVRPTDVEMEESWPAYQLGERAPIRVALAQTAACHLPCSPRHKVAGPSNIGNYLAQLGIEATAGLGVAYRGLHGADECIDLATIPLIQATYYEAVLALLGQQRPTGGS